MGKFSNAPVDRAAGGVVMRVLDSGREVAVVHRPRHDDWSLPKGHVDAGESWSETAVREVREETGYEAMIDGTPMSISYFVRGAPKVVVFYPMSLVGAEPVADADPDEVDEVAWWPVATAATELTYADERRVVGALMKRSGSAGTQRL